MTCLSTPPTLSTRFGSNASLPVARKKSNLSARVVRLSPFLRYLNFTKETFSGVMMDSGDFYSALKVHYTAGASSYTRTSLFSSSSTVAEAGNRIYGMACADVNHDGWTDLIVSGAKVSVFINQGYKGESNYIVKDGQQVIFNPNPAWASPHMTLKDMDGDGSLDLVTPWHICWNNAGN